METEDRPVDWATQVEELYCPLCQYKAARAAGRVVQSADIGSPGGS